jgi:hypothetical protein
MDHQHVLADIKTVHRADLDTVHVLALDAGFGDDIGHAAAPKGGGEPPPLQVPKVGR